MKITLVIVSVISAIVGLVYLLTKFLDERPDKPNVK